MQLPLERVNQEIIRSPFEETPPGSPTHKAAAPVPTSYYHSIDRAEFTSGPAIPRQPRTFGLDLYPKDMQHDTNLIASSRPSSHVVVHGPDGKLRRFAHDNGQAIRIQNTEHYVGKSLVQSSFHVYDPHKDALPVERAGFKIDLDNRSMSYRHNEKSVESPIVANGIEAYSLGDGKWMIPQPELRACTQASEAMLLAEGKSPQQVHHILQHVENRLGYTRRDTECVEISLGRHFGKEVKAEAFEGTHSEIASNIISSLEKRGTGIFLNGGHAMVLDHVADHHGKPTFAVREPLHGGYHVIGNPEKFIETQPYLGMEGKFRMIFRPSPSEEPAA